MFFFIVASLSPLGAREKSEKFDTDQDTGFYYTIKKGDTLWDWDLSQKFYNSQWDRMTVETRFNYPAIHRTGFIREEQMPALGTVLREKDGKILMPTDDIVYIRPTARPPFVPGHRYQIYSSRRYRPNTDFRSSTK